VKRGGIAAAPSLLCPVRPAQASGGKSIEVCQSSARCPHAALDRLERSARLVLAAERTQRDAAVEVHFVGIDAALLERQIVEFERTGIVGRGEEGIGGLLRGAAVLGGSRLLGERSSEPSDFTAVCEAV
jgi:hypothetical protein